MVTYSVQIHYDINILEIVVVGGLFIFSFIMSKRLYNIVEKSSQDSILINTIVNQRCQDYQKK